MSKKNRVQRKGANNNMNYGDVQHRQGDRNIQSCYSQKYQHTDSRERMRNGIGGEKGKDCIGRKELMISGLCIIPELNIKIQELHIHMDERTNSMYFYCVSKACMWMTIAARTLASVLPILKMWAIRIIRTICAKRRTSMEKSGKE